MTLAEQAEGTTDLRTRRQSMFLPVQRSHSVPQVLDGPSDPPAGGSGSLIAAAVNLGFSAERAQYHIIHWGVSSLAELMDLLLAEDGGKRRSGDATAATPVSASAATTGSRQQTGQVSQSGEGEVIMRRSRTPSTPGHHHVLPATPQQSVHAPAQPRLPMGTVLPTYEESQQEHDAEEFGFQAAFGSAATRPPADGKFKATRMCAATSTFEDPHTHTHTSLPLSIPIPVPPCPPNSRNATFFSFLFLDVLQCRRRPRLVADRRRTARTRTCWRRTCVRFALRS